VIAACVVGGTSLTGGRGSIVGTLWGTVFIGVLTNGLNLANVDPYVQKIALGVVIVIAVVGDQLGKGRAPAGR
jgi:ribose/xylose/arabinose/galactoside ABC-type transport system permease subunit